jgi:hypothetical protein
VDRGNARKVPIQPDRAQKGRAGDLIVRDVVEFQPAGVGVSHDHVAFAGHAAEISDGDDLPIQSDRSHEGSTGDLIIIDVVHLQSTGGRVAQDHVGFAEAAEIAEASDLPVQPDH